MAEETHLQRVKGSDPEQFVFLAFDRSEGEMKHMSGAMSEAEVRASWAATECLNTSSTSPLKSLEIAKGSYPLTQVIDPFCRSGMITASVENLSARARSTILNHLGAIVEGE